MVHDAMQKFPINNITKLAIQTGLTVPTVTKSIKRLCDLGIIEEMTGKSRNRVYNYQGYLNILNEGIGHF